MSKVKFIFSSLVLLVTFAVFIEVGITILGGHKYKNIQTQPKTLGFEDYLAQGNCTEPPGGCGEGYYWDTYHCSCRSSMPTGCTKPPGGCAEGWYWDSSDCACNYYNEPTPSPPTCTEPTGGCGINHYWDNNSCSCIFDGTSGCNPPPEGCGMSHYWDYGSCSCIYSSSCNKPTEGCGTNYYWDSDSCTCKYSGQQSRCTKPSGGCDYDYYWDYSSCSCQYNGYSECYEPVGGCGDGWYWDYNTCSCKSSGGCNAPQYGCGAGHYWDYDYCYCSSYDETLAPIGGYDETSGGGYQSSGQFDRLAYETKTRIECVKSILTNEEYQKLRYFIPTSENGYEEVRDLGKKVESCWKDSDRSQTEGRDSLESGFSSAYVENEKCLMDALGKFAYREIYGGEREPTYEEHLWFEKCYGNIKRDVITYATSDEELPDAVDRCLRNTLAGYYDRVKKGQVDVPPELRGGVDRCFGVNPQPFEESHAYKLPDEVRSCLIDALSEARFNEISSGRSEPTVSEKQKGELCFKKLNENQQLFLPPPPEQVPYFELDPETINFAEVIQEKMDIRGNKFRGKTKFSGKAPPNSTVTIYIFSEPIVVTTKTDENGDWVYDFDKPLEGGKHVAYAIVRTSSGKVVRSSVFDFEVLAASEEDVEKFLDESKALDTQTIFIRYAFVLIGAAFIVVLSMQSYNYFKRTAVYGSGNAKRKSARSGESKNDIGSGSVN